MPSGSTKHKLAFKGATIMGTLARYHAANLPELFEKINRNSIGLDDYLNRFWDNTTTENYPPYNLVNVSNHESRLEIALAGFKKKEVKVYTEYGKLFVVGSKKDKDETDEFIHRGMAQRSFERAWTIADDTIVKDVVFEDGLLTVTLSKVVPEHHARKDYL
jgi:HSP20 family molecular chaperone IbpA